MAAPPPRTRRLARSMLLAGCARATSADMWDLMRILMRHPAAPTAANVTAAPPAFRRFCGVATSPDDDNDFGAAALAGLAEAAGAHKVWYYNWGFETKVSATDALFVPTIRAPGGVGGDDLPQAGAAGVGRVVKGWNEPDDPGQAGRDAGLRQRPEDYAGAWVADMRAARARGYSEFVGPAIAHDTVWLDFFLKGCEGTTDCKEYMTYLACHRYRTDCGTYRADPEDAGWRDDLSYLLSMYRLMKKYNARGFNIKGIVMDELGCLQSDWWTPAAQPDQLRYMKEFYRDTIVAVRTGAGGMEEKILKTPWLMPKGPDAHAPDAHYAEGIARAVDGGPDAGVDTVAAIDSLATVAWFSQQPGRNYLLRGDRPNALGRAYLESCRLVGERVSKRRLAAGTRDILP